MALYPGDGKFKLPKNVKAYASWRTVNKPKWTSPWGRDIEPGGREAYCITAFGSEANLNKYKPLGAHIVDPGVNHSNIEDDVRVHDGIMGVLGRFFERHEATQPLAPAAKESAEGGE